MKKNIVIGITAYLAMVIMLSGCGQGTQDPGTPPEDVINPESSQQLTTDTSEAANAGEAGNESAGTGYGDEDILPGAVSVRIGRDSRESYLIDMYNNAATATMLDYLSSEALLFPTYTYDEEEGYVAQNIRGSYTRENEITVTDIKSGDVYLFSGGQLRFYFNDVDGADIVATPVGYFEMTENLADTVTEAYESNLGDTWGVSVYFWLTKNI